MIEANGEETMWGLRRAKASPFWQLDDHFRSYVVSLSA
jgi:hypothetical protein